MIPPVWLTKWWRWILTGGSVLVGVGATVLLGRRKKDVAGGPIAPEQKRVEDKVQREVTKAEVVREEAKTEAGEEYQLRVDTMVEGQVAQAEDLLVDDEGDELNARMMDVGKKMRDP